MKLTGKAGGNWNIGALSAMTNREFASTQDSLGVRGRQEIEPLAFYGVYRAQKEIARGQQGIGFLTTVAARAFSDPTLRDGRNSHSVFVGTDGWTFLDSSRTWVTTWRGGVTRIAGTRSRLLAVQRSSVHYFQQPDNGHVTVDSSATALTGGMGRVTLGKQKGNSFVNSSLGFIAPSFDLNDLGFLSRTGIVNMHFGGGYDWTKPGRVFRYVELGGAVFRNYDWDGNINWSGVFHFGSVQLKNFYWINWNAAYNPWTVNNRRTRGGPLTLNPPGVQFGINVNSDSRKPWTFGVGSGIYDARSDRNWWAWAELGWRPVSNVFLSLSPNLSGDVTPVQYIGTYDDSTATATFGKSYVFARLRSTELSAGIRLSKKINPSSEGTANAAGSRPRTPLG